MVITFISDTHGKHGNIEKDLPGGDLLIHSGDYSSLGTAQELYTFCKWFDSLDSYKHKVFISGNHELGVEQNYYLSLDIMYQFSSITYLHDSYTMVPTPEGGEIKIYGSPWQPEFGSWAFNLPRNGWQLKEVWGNVPEDVDILVTHGPPFGILDKALPSNTENLGCQLLQECVEKVKPKVHTFGHIHGSAGIEDWNDILFINASVLDEYYNYSHLPITFNINFGK